MFSDTSIPQVSPCLSRNVLKFDQTSQALYCLSCLHGTVWRLHMQHGLASVIVSASCHKYNIMMIILKRIQERCFD